MQLFKRLALFNTNKYEIGLVGLLFAILREVNIIDKNNASFPLKGFKHDYQIVGNEKYVKMCINVPVGVLIF